MKFTEMHKPIIFLLSLFLIIFSSCESEKQEKTNPETPVEKVVIVQPKIEYGFNYNDYTIDTGRVQQNEGLTHILPKYGISASTIFQIVANFDSVFNVKTIKPEHLYTAFLSKDSTNRLLKFVYKKDPINYVVFDFEDSLLVYLGQKEVVVKELAAGGLVTSSLWNAFMDQGLSPALVHKVTQLYAWSIDFFGIQKGDYYKVIYEANFVDGEFVGTGRIKSILFNHLDKSIYFFSYKNDTMAESYYSEDGESMKRALLSAPLEYTRVSSIFSNSRFHPVLKYYRPHHGVDYAAPMGTEVVATGNGIVTFAGWAGQAGRMVKIIHSTGDIETKYLHLRRFADGIKKGVHVSQGQKIGEVGSSGSSTGPHLDYRVYIKGKAVDPLSIDIPSVEPLKDSALITYRNFISPIKINLDNIEVDTTVI